MIDILGEESKVEQIMLQSLVCKIDQLKREMQAMLQAM